MTTQYITVSGIKLAFHVFNESQLKTIFFIHGNSSSANAWRKQVVSPLLRDYRLVSIDLPNHGDSAALKEGMEYSLPAIANMLAEGMQQIINPQPFIICGISLGTNIVAEMMVSALAPKGLFFAGPCIIGKGFEMDKMVQAGVDVSAVFAEAVPEQTVVKYASTTSISTETSDRKNFLEDYNKVQGKFRSSLYATIAAGNFNDEIDLLVKKNIPVGIVFGKDEKVVNITYLDQANFLLWNKQVYTLAAASHLVNIDAPQAFNELLAAFAKELL